MSLEITSVFFCPSLFTQAAADHNRATVSSHAFANPLLPLQTVKDFKRRATELKSGMEIFNIPQPAYKVRGEGSVMIDTFSSSLMVIFLFLFFGSVFLSSLKGAAPAFAPLLTYWMSFCEQNLPLYVGGTLCLKSAIIVALVSWLQCIGILVTDVLIQSVPAHRRALCP